LTKVYLWDDEAMLWPTAGSSCIDPSLKGWSLPLIDHGWIYKDEHEDDCEDEYIHTWGLRRYPERMIIISHWPLMNMRMNIWGWIWGWRYEDEYEHDCDDWKKNYSSLICWSISLIDDEWRWGCQLQWTLSDFWMISRWIVILMFMICCSK